MGIRLISISSEVTNNPPTSLYYEDFHYPIQQKQDDDEYDERLRSGSGNGKEIFWKPGPFRGLLYPEDPSAPVSLDFPRGYTNLRSRSPKTPQEFFKEYAKVLLICGLMAICAVFFQFLTSFLLLCFINRVRKESLSLSLSFFFILIHSLGFHSKVGKNFLTSFENLN
jgi:hypothetical protein